MKQAYKILFLLSFLSACTTAPLTEPHTARTLGEGNNEWSLVGGTPTFYSVGYTRGVNERLDIGGLVEFQSIGSLIALQAKYLLTPSNMESPFSILVGAGAGDSTTFGYLGGIKSFRIVPEYEISFTLRYNVFNWDISDVADVDDASEFIDDFIDVAVDEINGTYTYASFDMSNTYWFNSSFGATLSLGALYFLGEEDAEVSPKASLKFNFNY